MLLDGSRADAVERAAAALAAGELVAFPTETVYGLGARADDDAAVAKIFKAKGRPADHPLIVHVADAAAARRFAASVSPLAERLMAGLWPGPLTVIVPRAAGMAAAAAGWHPTIGLRCPSHPVAQALLQRCAALGVWGVAAPSANRFGRVSPTTAAHVESEFDGRVTVLDGGACQVGIESSIVDCSREFPVLLRPGVLTRAQIEAATGMLLRDRDADAPRASGTLQAHYAPSARLRLMSAEQLSQTLENTLEKRDPSGLRLAVYSRTRPANLAPGVLHRLMPATASEVAQELFAVLRAFDDDGVQVVWVEEPPSAPEWDGVRDRLHRAAAS